MRSPRPTETRTDRQSRLTSTDNRPIITDREESGYMTSCVEDQLNMHVNFVCVVRHHERSIRVKLECLTSSIHSVAVVVKVKTSYNDRPYIIIDKVDN